MTIRDSNNSFTLAPDLVTSCEDAVCLRLWLCNRKAKMCRCSTKSGDILCLLKDVTEKSAITLRQGKYKGQVTIEPAHKILELITTLCSVCCWHMKRVNVDKHSNQARI